jgi:hypothetical protein
VASFSTSAAVAIAGNATAAHCAEGERGGNSSARPIDVTNGPTLADDYRMRQRDYRLRRAKARVTDHGSL